MDISVIVTVYNIKSYIRECIESILSQKDVEFEVICVDDASTDGSDSILDEYKKKDSRIRVLKNLKNEGLASARNKGYRLAGGEYLYNIDGDDLLAEGALYRMHQVMKEHDLDLLAFSAKAFFDDDYSHVFGNEDDYVRRYEYPGIYSGPDLFARLMKNGDRAIANRVMYCYKKSYFLQNDLFDEEGLRYADDSMFSYYMTARRVRCIPDQLYLRRYRVGSTITSPLKKRYLESMVVLFVSEMCRWKKIELSEEINEQIEKYFDLRLKEIYRLKTMFQSDQSSMAYLSKYPMIEYFYKRFIEQEPVHVDCLSDIQLNRIKQEENIILYGAGYIATEIAKILEYNNVTDYKVAVTSTVNNGEKFRGRRVHNIQELAGMQQALVIVAMSVRNKKDVMDILETYNFKKIMWITLWKEDQVI
jgi:glycosyltransferase involved in cell wall biosynthesis